MASARRNRGLFRADSIHRQPRYLCQKFLLAPVRLYSFFTICWYTTDSGSVVMIFTQPVHDKFSHAAPRHIGTNWRVSRENQSLYPVLTEYFPICRTWIHVVLPYQLHIAGAVPFPIEQVVKVVVVVAVLDHWVVDIGTVDGKPRHNFRVDCPKRLEVHFWSGWGSGFWLRGWGRCKFCRA